MASTPTRAGGPAEPSARGAGTTPASARSVGTWAFAGVAVSSLGGPLALAALIVPAVTADAVSSAGLVAIAGAVVFLAPLAIWLRYASHLPAGDRTGPSGGLYSFVLAAAGRRVALAQAAVWTFSYRSTSSTRPSRSSTSCCRRCFRASARTGRCWRC